MDVQDQYIDQIERYLEGQMSEAEQAAFVEQLKQNPELEALFEQKRQLYAGLWLQAQEELRSQLLGKENMLDPVVPFWRRRSVQIGIASAAAVLLLAIFLPRFWPKNPSTRAELQLAFHLPKNEPPRGMINTMGETDSSAFSQAKFLIAESKYEQAKLNLEQLLPTLSESDSQVEAYVLLTFCYLQENQLQQAKEALNQLPYGKEKLKNYAPDVHWYRIQILLAEGQPIDILQGLVGIFESENHPWMEEALKLEKALGKIDQL